MLGARTVGSMVEMAPHERCFPDGGGRHGPRQNQIIADSRLVRTWRLPVSASRDIKRGVHPAFRLATLKSGPPSAPSRERKSPMSRQLVLCACAAGLRHDDGRDGSFRRPARADATGTGADRALAARHAGDAAPDPATPDAMPQAPEEPIGNVATVTGSASVIRNDTDHAAQGQGRHLSQRRRADGANSTLGITFIDATTFNLKASTKITIDNYVYEDGGKRTRRSSTSPRAPPPSSPPRSPKPAT